MLERCLSVDQPGWLTLRMALWSWPEAEHRKEMAAIIAATDSQVALLASDDAGRPQGFAEAGLRRDYVNGASTSPVAFLEGIYVAADARGQGIARGLVAAVERWALDLSCTELASDALLDNADGQAVHRALGFRETERVVYFIKAVP